MGFLDRLFSRHGSRVEVEAVLHQKRDPKTDPRPWDGTRGLSVVGESFYQEGLRKVSGAGGAGDHSFECDVLLVPEPDNPHDPKAIAVMAIDGVTKLGHLSRHNARRERRKVLACIEENGEARCQAFIGRSGDNPNLGMRLRISLAGPLA